MCFNLFALSSNPAKRIARFNLTHEVQDELAKAIKEQEESFDDVTEEIEFDGKYKPDKGERLYINNYDDIDGLKSAIEDPLSVESVDNTEDFFYEIKAIFTGYQTQLETIKILLQHFDKRRIISTAGLSIFHSSDVYKKIDGVGLTIDQKLTATLEEGKLSFYSFHMARQVFDLSQYYKEATDEDVKQFINSDVIRATNIDNILSMADSWVRRKISLIQQTGILTTVSVNEMKAAAIDFNIPFETIQDNGRELIKLPDNKSDLKKLLRFLDEDYYKSPLSKTNFVTNSKRVVEV